MKTTRSATPHSTADAPQTAPEALGRFAPIISLLVFAVSLAVLWWNAAPGVTFHDSGEFAMAAADGGIPHPPGAPTWCMFATAFVKLGAFDNPAYGSNLFCGLCGAITLGLLCWVAMTWTRILYPRLPRWIFAAAGISAPALMLHSSGFLEQSLMTEQYTIMTALIMGMLVVATKMFQRAPDALPGTGLAAVLGLLWGLAVGNHLSQVALGLLVVWALWAASGHENRRRGFLRLGVSCAFGLLLGLLVFLWLPIRSHADPAIDWGNIETWDRFVWAIKREQFRTRAWSDVPPNLTAEWIASYDPVGQLGVAGVILTLGGVLALVRKHRLWLGWLAAVAVPYGAGMLLGHMRQYGIESDYTSCYGVVDWHLPIYLALVLAASAGLTALASRLWNSRARTAAYVVVPAILCALIAVAGITVKRMSFRHYTAPELYVQDILATLPDKAFMVAGQDNTAFALGYARYIEGRPENLWLAVRTSVFAHKLMAEPEWANADPDAVKLEFMRRNAEHPHQPYHPPLSDVVPGQPIHLYVDFIPEYREEADYLLPAGFLFESAGRRVSNAEVMEAEHRWQSEFPDLFREPSPDSYRLERDAYARVYTQRGVYFGTRKLWPQAEDAFERAVRWQPQNGTSWFYLADALEHGGKPDEAVEAYKKAIELLPCHVPTRYNLAMLCAKAGYYAQAEQLLLDAQRLDPNDKDVRRNLARVREKMREQAE